MLKKILVYLNLVLLIHFPFEDIKYNFLFYADGEDELGCGNCGGDDLLRCGTGSDCVSVGYACDGQRQCPDG